MGSGSSPAALVSRSSNASDPPRCHAFAHSPLCDGYAHPLLCLLLHLLPLQFKYIDLKPDPKNESCHASYWNVSKLDTTAKYVERDGQWHHLAVSWSTADEGLTKIYWDGLLVASAYSHKTQPLEPGGAFMLGAEQVGLGGLVGDCCVACGMCCCNRAGAALEGSPGMLS